MRLVKFRARLARPVGMYGASTSLTQAYVPTDAERLSAAIAHGGTCIAWFFAPLVIFLVERGRSDFAARNALQALLWSAAGTLVSAATCGLALPVFLVFHIVAAVKAYEGETYEYPFVGAFVRHLATRPG